VYEFPPLITVCKVS